MRTARHTYGPDLKRLWSSEERLVLWPRSAARDEGFFCSLTCLHPYLFVHSFIIHVFIVSNSTYFKFAGRSELAVFWQCESSAVPLLSPSHVVLSHSAVSYPQMLKLLTAEFFAYFLVLLTIFVQSQVPRSGSCFLMCSLGTSDGRARAEG